MRLLDPGIGEITDRLTILSLKILFGEQLGKDTSHFKVERTALLAKVRSRDLNGAWFDKVLELAAVNAALWHAEDDLRDLRKLIRVQVSSDPAFTEPTCRLAFLIQELNDIRAGLVGEINKIAGDEKGMEKIS